jgi:hypothetical protein
MKTMKTESEIRDVRAAINDFTSAKGKLRKMDVVRSERLVGEIGEWFVAELYGGDRATSTSQKGWDVVVGQTKIQVKTHAKGDDNTARWTELKNDLEGFDELAVVVFTKDFILEEFYRVPIADVRNALKPSGKSFVVKWDSLKRHRIELDHLPRQNELVKYFR